MSENKNYKIYADQIDGKTMSQFFSAMKEPYVVKGALMPDAHAGYALPIGSVVATDGVVVPSWVGYDIGCGMSAIKTSFSKMDVIVNSKLIFESMYRAVPVGFQHNKHDTKWNDNHIPRTNTMKEIFNNGGRKQLGSLGGGNHFIEIGYDKDDIVWVIVHSGSRGVGHATATHYMKLASGDGKAREGHYWFSADSDNGKDYIMDLHFCQEFALKNREEIVNRTLGQISHYCGGERKTGELINRNHNHAELKNGWWIHRKGATQAELGMLGVIPGNMRDGSFIVEGKGNPESLWSSSHGAGRMLSRSEAKRVIDIDDFRSTMGDVVCKAEEGTIDESPFAYKNIFEVMNLQKDLVEIKNHIKPIINIKANETRRKRRS